MSANFNVWTTSRVFMVKARPARVVTNTKSYQQLKPGALKIGIFAKNESTWLMNQKFMISLESAELGHLLNAAKQSWTFQKTERDFDNERGGESGAYRDRTQPQTGENGGEMLIKKFTATVNPKAETIVVNLSVKTKAEQELHNVSTDLDQGAWFAFREIVRTSIPLLCGFDSELLRQNI